MTNQSHIKQLFERYATRAATPEEIRELYQLAQGGQFDEELKALLVAKLEDTDISDDYNVEEWTVVFEKIKDDISAIEQEVPVRKKWFGYAKVGFAAAVALIVVGVYFFNYKKQSVDGDVNIAAQDVAPGTVGATLTLASGKKIRLSAAANGEIAQEAGISVSKTDDGQLVYEVKERVNDPDKINTLTTTKGETYAVVLPDKSKVWLNAASSLTYSANLVQNGYRRVRLSGEAYLEVAKDKAHPFVVESRGQQVEVLGTHFNINAYDDDPVMKTTLAEGRVKVMASGRSIILRPNQQAVTGNGTISMKEVDAELALAWKAGFFLFDRESLESIMLKIARWYDVEIVFNDPSLKAKTFTGTVSRFEKISQVFNMLEQSQVAKFKIEGKKIKIDKMK